MDNRFGYIVFRNVCNHASSLLPYPVRGYDYIIRVLLIYNMGFAIIKRALTYAYIVHVLRSLVLLTRS